MADSKYFILSSSPPPRRSRTGSRPIALMRTSPLPCLASGPSSCDSTSAGRLSMWAFLTCVRCRRK
eukprot:13780132-Alexandrium_andersonii.AAC.1